MGLLDDVRLDIGDDDGAIPSGITPPIVIPLSSGFAVSLVSDVRIDVGDDAGTIPSGSVILVVTPLPSGSDIGLVSDVRIDIGDDTGAIPSGGVPPTVIPLPLGAATSLVTDVRIDIGDDDNLIPSGIINGVGPHLFLGPQHIDTTPASPSPGDLILGGATWGVLASGNEGQRLGVIDGQVKWAEIPSGLHVRYTDEEASGVAVQVTTSGILEHTAISGAHHPRYTDEEAAIVAVQVLATGISVAVLQESGVELTADATTTAVQPIYSTLLSTSINLINPSGNLRIMATAAVNATTAVPVLFRIYIDGTFYRATTVNVTGAIDNASIVIPRVATTGANPHTVSLRWAKFNQPFTTVRCLPSTSPDFYHASLSIQEIN